MRTIIVLIITTFIVYKVFSIIIKDFKKNKNFCSTECGSCNSTCATKKEH